jgi:IS605 OrfB family transposase
MHKTVRCRLRTTRDDEIALRDSLDRFAAACNETLAYALATGKRHKFGLSHDLYRVVKPKYGLIANVAVRVFDRVAHALAANHVKAFRPTSLICDNQTLRYIEAAETVSISTCSGRRKIPLILGNYHRPLLAGFKYGYGSTLSVDRKGRFWVNIVITLPDVPAGGTEPLGVDLGIKRIATLSNGVTFSGRTLNRKRERYARTKASLQRKGTNGAKRLLKRLAGRELRFQRDMNHNISKQIVALARESDSYLVMENLTGIGHRGAKKGKHFRRMVGRWNFYTLKQFIAYKAAEAGVRLVTVDPRYTSKTCPYCGHLGHREKLKFTCFTCGLVGDADLVGAFNIAAKGAQVDRPEVASCIER